MLQVRPRKKKQRQKIHKQYYIKHNHKRQNHPQRKPQNNMHVQNLQKQVHLHFDTRFSIHYYKTNND